MVFYWEKKTGNETNVRTPLDGVVLAHHGWSRLWTRNGHNKKTWKLTWILLENSSCSIGNAISFMVDFENCHSSFFGGAYLQLLIHSKMVRLLLIPYDLDRTRNGEDQLDRWNHREFSVFPSESKLFPRVLLRVPIPSSGYLSIIMDSYGLLCESFGQYLWVVVMWGDSCLLKRSFLQQMPTIKHDSRRRST